MARVQARSLTRKAAGLEAGVGYSAIRGWLQRANSRLSDATLEQLTTWLGIPIEEALREQGGRAEDRRKAAASKALSASWERRSHGDPELGAKLSKLGADAIRNTTFSDQHRQRISASLKAYRRRPGAHVLHTLDTDSIEHRLTSVLVDRLRRCTAPSEATVREWADVTSARYDVCIHQVLEIWNGRLGKRGLPLIGGRPGDVARCDAMRAFARTPARSWSGKKRPSGWWGGAPEDPIWCEGHSRRCAALRNSMAARDLIRTPVERDVRATQTQGGFPLSLSAVGSQPE